MIKHIVTVVAGVIAIMAIGATLTLRDQFPLADAKADSAVAAVATPKPIRNVMEQPFSSTTTAVLSDRASLHPDAAADTSENRNALTSVDAVDGLSLSRQRWQRGGLGSQALLTFTLTNRNAFAVKDIQLSCAFTTPDGSYTTSRTRVIHDTVRTKARKRYEQMLVGFVTSQVSNASCELVGASRA